MSSTFTTSHSLISPPSFTFSGRHTPPLPNNLRSPPPSKTSAKASANTTTTNSFANTNAYSLYQILGIPITATEPEIKSAYRRLARTCHPDVLTVSRKNASADEFIEIHEAYCTLSDPEKRADYDRNIVRIDRSRRDSREAVFERSGSGYSGRNWESDQCWS